MPKFDFNKIAKELYSNRTSAGCLNLLHIFRTYMQQNNSEWMLLQFNNK